MKQIDKKYLGKDYVGTVNLKAIIKDETGLENFPYAYIQTLIEGELYIGYYERDPFYSECALLSSDGVELIGGFKGGDFSFLKEAKDENELKNVINRFDKEYSKEFAYRVGLVKNGLVRAIIENPEIINSVPSLFSKIFPDFKKTIVLVYQEAVYKKLEEVPAGGDCKEIYEETQKTLDMFKQRFSEWDKAIEDSENFRDQTKNLFKDFDVESENE